MEENKIVTEQPVAEPVTEPVVAEAVKPEKTGGVKAMCIIAKIAAILGFVMAIVSFFTIFVLVVSYNLRFGFKEIPYSQIDEFLATAAAYKGYAKILLVCAILALMCGIAGLVLNKIVANKGFGSKLVKVFSILAIVFGTLAAFNSGLNIMLFGRYEVRYHYY
ncbi:MAG: hypothetical protein IJC07_00985 [Clostridia bacterium]|nr:hypothetical protein [Clostridia bacterium]